VDARLLMRRITFETAKNLIGLPISNEVPEEVFRLTILYRPARDGQSSVFYLPGPRYKERERSRRLISSQSSTFVECYEKLIPDVPRIRKKERLSEEPRTVKLADDQYNAILENSPRWLQRVIIAGNEGGFDRSTLLELQWSNVDGDLIVIERQKTGVKQMVGISPVLAAVLAELRAEKTAEILKRVFTYNGKPIPVSTLRHAFDRAVEAGGLFGLPVDRFPPRGADALVHERPAD
jgi:hypothetical protein